MEYLDLRVADSWGHGRTDTYRGSVVSKDDRELKVLKKNTQMTNKALKQQAYNAINRQAEWGHSEEELSECIDNLFSWKGPQRVALYARGKRTGADGKVLHPNAYSNLRHEYASYFDVYVTECSSVYEFKNKLFAEFCPTLARIKEIELELWSLKWKMKHEQR